MGARRPTLTLLAALLPVLFAGSLAGQTRPEPLFPLTLLHAAPPGCPSREAVLQALRARDLAFREAALGEPATRLTLRIEPEGAQFRGLLELQLLSGERTSRALSGALCADVSTSLTLVAALALAPLAAPPPSASLSPVPAASSSGALPAPLLAPTPPAPSASVVAPPPAPTATASVAAPSVPPRAEARWSAGLEVGLMSALAPGVAPGVSAWVERQRGGWSARLSAGYWPDGTTQVAGYRADFSGYLGALDGCARATLGEAWTGGLCAGLQAGALAAAGRDVANPRAEVRPWLAPRLGARFGVATGGGHVEALGGVFFPVFRDAFAFEQPRIEVHRPAVVGGWVGLGGGFDFL